VVQRGVNLAQQAAQLRLKFLIDLIQYHCFEQALASDADRILAAAELFQPGADLLASLLQRGAGVHSGKVPAVARCDALQPGNERARVGQAVPRPFLKQLLQARAERWLDAEVQVVDILIAFLDLGLRGGLRDQRAFLR